LYGPRHIMIPIAALRTKALVDPIVCQDAAKSGSVRMTSMT
jgi:hypothetical protein